MTQHYDFGHRLLVDFVLDRPRERVEQLLFGSTVDFLLEDLWDEAGDIDPFDGAPDDDEAFIEANYGEVEQVSTDTCLQAVRGLLEA